MAKITELAHMIRSRKVSLNSYEVDIIFKDYESYLKVVDKAAVTKDVIAKLYNIPESKVANFENFDAGHLIHFVLPRPGGHASGEPAGETDVNGGIQYIPLIDLKV